MAEAIVVLTTAGSEAEARRIAARLLERRLAACVNLVPRIRSLYTWKGTVADEEEWLLLCKARPEAFEAVRDAIREVHSYEVPEVLALEVSRGDPAYLGWLRDCTGPEG